MIRLNKLLPGLGRITLHAHTPPFVTSSSSVTGVSRISRDRLNILPLMIAVMATARLCSKRGLLPILTWCWLATSYHPLVAPVPVHSLNFHWRSDPPPFLRRPIKWPMVYWLRLRSMAYLSQRISPSLVMTMMLLPPMYAQPLPPSDNPSLKWDRPEWNFYCPYSQHPRGLLLLIGHLQSLEDRPEGQMERHILPFPSPFASNFLPAL